MENLKQMLRRISIPGQWKRGRLLTITMIVNSLLLFGLLITTPEQIVWAGVPHQTVPTAKPSGSATPGINPTNSPSQPDEPTATSSEARVTPNLGPTDTPVNIPDTATQPVSSKTIQPTGSPIAETQAPTKRIFPTRTQVVTTADGSNLNSDPNSMPTSTPLSSNNTQTSDTQQRPIAATLTAVARNSVRTDNPGTLDLRFIGLSLIGLALGVGLFFVFRRKR